MNLTSTVIIASYNGEKYLHAQLQSIYEQKTPVTKVLISDDGSSDNTEKVARDFIYQHHLSDSWDFQVNAKRLGWRENFLHMLAQTDTDIVFYCDQDDLWYADKVSESMKIFTNHPDAELLVSDFDYLPARQNLLTMFAIDESNDQNLTRVSATLANLITLRPGCAMAVRKTIIPTILNIFHEIPIDGNGLPQTHDQPTWLAALLRQSLYHIKKALFVRRAHADSAWQLEKRANSGHFAAIPSENDHFPLFIKSVQEYLNHHSLSYPKLANELLTEIETRLLRSET
ncbi:MAG: glycosyltransferase [Oenococcus sp.]|uniref:glycosyltransferase n=1 Tax=Oenococcus sp. TaxID=1979414 RepID=UPI0039E8ECD6